MVRPTSAPFAFDLPDVLSAQEPPEKRGLARDGIRLLAAERSSGKLTHARFHQLADFLEPGDCLVFNASRTLPASLDAFLEWPSAQGASHASGASGMIEAPEASEASSAPKVTLQLRLARRVDGNTWSALILGADDEPWIGDLHGARLVFSNKLLAEVLGFDTVITKLWDIRFNLSGPALMDALCRHGNPIRYWYASSPWDLDYYQTVYAREPGSAEMPSAGRAFTWKLLMDLRRKGINTAFLVLHAGISSYMDREFDITHPASEEPFRIDAPAAEAINASKAAGGRIVAVGTTVVRALESAADESGRVRALAASTRLRITREHRLRVVDGLLTGLHEPEASHLDLLTAFLPETRLRAIYDEALREKYLWHEFGDANLIL